jgi:ATP-binding cassette subfamily B (MDR/TAP) protein 1
MDPPHDNPKQNAASGEMPGAVIAARSSKTHVALDIPSAAAANSKNPGGVPPPKKLVPYLKLFRFATVLNKCMTLFAVVCAAAAGSFLPVTALFIGDLSNGINDPANFDDVINVAALRLLLVGIGAFFATYLSNCLAMLSSELQGRRLRQAYFQALMRQDMKWYDTNNPGEISSRLVEDTLAFQNGIGEKLSQSISFLAQFVAGIVIAFVASWKMTLVLIAFLPLLAGAGAFVGKVFQNLEQTGQTAYAKASNVANEALQSLRTVIAFSGEANEVKRYDDFLVEAERVGTKKGAAIGFSLGTMMLVMMSTYGVGLFYGGTLVISSREENGACTLAPSTPGCFSGGQTLQVLFAMIIGAMALGQAAPNLGAMGGAQGAAVTLFEIIDATPSINVEADGRKVDLQKFRGKIEFLNVSFAYPSRPTEHVLRNFSLIIQPGEHLAVCGPSGCGKSTLLQLIGRMYDPTEGSVLVDDINVREYDLRSLRSLIGIVTQEPQLFNATVEENISLGSEQLRASSNSASLRANVVAAAVTAQAHAFISALPQGYDTDVSTTQLSGGQKQRVAIARAVVRKPRILLLDEATSALDTQSEQEVQLAIENVLHSAATAGSQQMLTSVVIAHRLSTIRNASRIIVLQNGSIIEHGTHTELLSRGGVYASMYELQGLGGTGTPSASGHPHREKSTAEDPTADVHLSVLTELTAAKPVPVHVAEGRVTSITVSAADNNVEKSTKKVVSKVPFSRLWEYQREDRVAFFVGLIAATLNGLFLPAFSIIMSRFVSGFYDIDNEVVRKNSLMYMGVFIALGVAAGLFNVTQSYMFSYAGERMTRRLRRAVFQSYLRQEVAWHDLPENSTGSLTTRLSTDAVTVRQALGDRLGLTFQNTASMIAGLVIAFTASWRLTLVVLGSAPLMVIVGSFEVKAMSGFQTETKKSYQASGKVASEAVGMAKTIMWLGLDEYFVQRFGAALEAPARAALRHAAYRGITAGFTQFFMMAIYALSFWSGAQFVKQGWMTFQDLLQSFFAVIMSAMGAGNTSAMVVDSAKAAEAKNSLFAILDRTPQIDASNSAGMKTATIQGSVEFKDVSFAYPSRPSQQVLHGVSFTIEAGKTTAFVGPSGCGKSTIIQLLQRFYDPSAGEIVLDGVHLKDYNVQFLREHEGWVQQEAPLFADSIAYNISYGVRGTAKAAHDAGMPKNAKPEDETPSGFVVPPDVLQAAVSANVAEYVSGFKHGYATNAGDLGSQLSGGQKQRVAIARALIRNPAILLLDEATSALDSQSEQVVTATIERLLANAQRTTVIVAHRLSTIKQADRIVVLDQGRVVEVGTHASLLHKSNGVYRSLALAQDPNAA